MHTIQLRCNVLTALMIALASLVNLACPTAQAEEPGNDQPLKVVVRREGDDGSRSYRIPGLAVSKQGTLLACFDVRWANAKDLPADIDVGLMRSTDGGNSWGKMIIAMDYDKSAAESMGNGVGDAAILVDSRDGTIYLAALWSFGNNGWNGSSTGLEKETTGQLVICRSRDDGLTWDNPVSITQQIKLSEWKMCFQGPGAGIQLTDGTLVFAAQFKDKQGKPSSCFIHSTDGEHWKISPAAIPGAPPTSEAQVVQTSRNSLLITMRNESRAPKRLWARWEWKDQLSDGAWSPFWDDVQDPVCMASLIAHPSGTLVLSNNNSTKREKMTLRYSNDQGKSWSQGRLLDSRPSAYSCMAIMPDGSIGILYEVGDKSNVETLTFAKVSMDWIKSDKSPK